MDFQTAKKTIRIINLASYLSHTDPLFRSSNILKINDIYKLNQMKFLYKLINKSLPSYFNSFSYKSGSDVHTYHTRNRNKLRTVVIKHEFVRGSLRCSLPLVYNSMSDFIIDRFYTFGWNSISDCQKKVFTSSYSEACTLLDCYSCNRH